MTGERIPPGYRFGRRIVLAAVVTVVLVLFTLPGAPGVLGRLYSACREVTLGLWSWVGDLFT